MPDQMGSLAATDSYPLDEQQAAQDAFEAFAARTRQSVQPVGGRTEAPGQIVGPVVNALVTQPVNKARGLMQTMADYSANEFPETMGAVAQTTDYDPRSTAADYAAGTALNTLGTVLPFAQSGAMGTFGGKLVQPTMGELVDQAAPPFYSAAQRAVENAKLGKGTPEQWTGYLRNQPGVKGEEVERVFGNLPSEGMLTKADMQAHAAENAVTLGEVNKGGNISDAKVKEYHDISNSVWNRASEEQRTELRNEFLRNEGLTEGTSPTKYSQWQLPGGENYREKLLTLPRQTEFEKVKTQIASRLGRPADTFMTDLDKGYFNISPEEYQALSAARAAPNNQIFQSSHWDEPNVLAHMRMNDREVPGVGKSLHLEEIQSDWHQKGRQQGYQKAPTDQEVLDYTKNYVNSFHNDPKAWDSMPADAQAMRLEGGREQLMQRGIPNAPFKSTWPDVALKRSIRDAAEGGYDALSWTPGEAQAARYDLSKHISDIELHGTGDNLRLSATGTNGRKVIDMQHTTPQDLADHIGKEAAEKLLAQPEPDIAKNPYAARRLANVDLKVGGEGMKAFYDKMLVDKANALGKKHGARVEQQTINSMDKNKLYDDLIQQGYWPGEAEDMVARKMVEGGGGNQPVHVLRITPQLREAAMKGFPLFSAGGIVAGGVMGGLADQGNYQQ